MVDQIEVKLSSEDKNDLKEKIAYQVALDRAIAEASSPDAVSSKPAGSSGYRGGGILDGALAVATGIITVDLLKNILSQSQILSTVTTNMFKAVGLAVDLVLLPFMPLIVWFLMGIYGAILLLKPKTPDPTGTAGGFLDGGAPGSSIGALAADRFISDLTGGLLNTKTALALAGALVTGVALVLLGAPLMTAVIVSALVAGIISVLTPYAADLGSKVGRMAYDAGYAFMQSIRELMDEPIRLIQNFFTFNWLKDPWKGIQDTFWTFFKFAWLLNPFAGIMTTILQFFAFTWLGVDPFKVIRDWITGFLSFDWLPSWVRTSLGVGSSTGSTTNNSSAVTNTFNLSGLTSDQLQSQVDNILRKNGTRYGV